VLFLRGHGQTSLSMPPIYKLENRLLELVESLEQKRARGEWTDHLMVKESNAIYGSE